MSISYNNYPISIDRWGIEFMSLGGWAIWVWPWMRKYNQGLSIYSLDFMVPFENQEKLKEFDDKFKEDLSKVLNGVEE